MTGLRILRKKVLKPMPEYGENMAQEVTQDVLQYHSGQHGWLDIPVVEEQQSNKSGGSDDSK